MVQCESWWVCTRGVHIALLSPPCPAQHTDRLASPWGNRNWGAVGRRLTWGKIDLFFLVKAMFSDPIPPPLQACSGSGPGAESHAWGGRGASRPTDPPASQHYTRLSLTGNENERVKLQEG